jgi:hypothetical protein
MTTLKEDINRILNLMLLEKKTIDIEEIEENELSEDEDASASSSGGGASSGYPSIEKWETGVTRGPGNTLGGKREDKTKRGKGNMLGKAGEKWSSGRTFGKTGKYSA